MKITSAEFVKSIIDPAQLPRDGRPEFAFAGRSNVGKSSLLNRILNRKGLAKTSATPGKTQTLNYFNINGRIYFVDLPGYGYAKVPKHLKDQWNSVMLDYLAKRKTLRLAIHLIDGRHAPMKNDIEMVSLLDEAEVPTLIVATKVDKLSKAQRDRTIGEIRSVLELEEDAYIIPFSSVTGEGVGPVLEIIEEFIEKPRD